MIFIYLFKVVGAPFLDTRRCNQFLTQRQQANKHQGHHSLHGIVFTEQHFRPTFNKHKDQICKGFHFRFNLHIQEREKGAEANFFALGVYFLFFCVREHSESFKWRDPKEGYEYNFTDPPLLLIYGHERWWHCFEEAARGGDEEQAIARVEECMLWADEEAQQFAEASHAIHLYN